MDPVDRMLDELLRISSQLIQTSSSALATTIQSRKSLSTVSRMESQLLDETIRHKEEELDQKLHSIQAHQRELDRIQAHLVCLWPPHPPLIRTSPEDTKPAPTPPRLHRRNTRDRSSSSGLSAKDHVTSPTEQILSPSLPSVQSDRPAILPHRPVRQPFQMMMPHPHRSSSSSSLASSLLSPLRLVSHQASSIFKPFHPPIPPTNPNFASPSLNSTTLSTPSSSNRLLSPSPEPLSHPQHHPHSPASLALHPVPSTPPHRHLHHHHHHHHRHYYHHQEIKLPIKADLYPP